MENHSSPGRLFGVIVVGLGVILSAPEGNAATDAKPNIVFIISDDHRWDGLGIAGNDNIKTPHLDQLAREGQWFKEATIHSPICTVSRATLLTGVPPHEHGWYSNGQQRKDVLHEDGLVTRQKLLPNELAKAGYHTAFTGKWHLIPNPADFGFETVRHWMLGGMGRFKNPKLANGKSSDTKNVDGFTQTIFADDSIDIIKDHAESETTRPLFLWTSFTAPHLPFKPNPDPINGMYDDKSPTELAPETFNGNADETRNAKMTWRKYYEAISAMDAEIGRIMATIKESRLSTNTVVVFLGDNGFMMGERGLWGKTVPYDASIRVPLIVWGPDSIVGTKGTTVTASVNSLDLPPTFVRLAGATPPENWSGRDARPVLKDGNVHEFTWAVSMFPDISGDPKEKAAYRTIRTPTHKLIMFHPKAKLSHELYDLKADPGEKTNLFGTPALADVQNSLTAQLADYRERTGDDSWDVAGPVVSQRENNEDESIDNTYNKNRDEGRKKRAGRKQKK